MSRSAPRTRAGGTCGRRPGRPRRPGCREQPDHLGVDVEQRQAAVTAVGRGQPVVRGHGRRPRDISCSSPQQDALGRPGGPARAQEDPAAAAARAGGGIAGRILGRPGSRTGPGSSEHGEPGLQVIADHRPRLRYLQHPRHVAGGGAGIERDRYPARRQDADQRARRSRTHPAAGPPPGRRRGIPASSRCRPRPGPSAAARRRSASRRRRRPPGTAASPRLAAASSICSVSTVRFRSDRSAEPACWIPVQRPERGAAPDGTVRERLRAGPRRRGSQPAPAAAGSARAACLRPVSGTASGVRASRAVSRMPPK